MRDMTEKQALEEARRRWGDEAAVRLRPPPVHGHDNRRGRLAPYRYSVGNFGLGKRCTVKGMGDTWREAFEDAEATPWAR